MIVADTIRAFQIQNKFRNATEIRNPILLSAQGTIPDWLNGVLYRVGPAKYNLSDNGKQHAINHAFDGLTFVHRFEISAKQQTVKYNSRLTAESAEKTIVKNPTNDTYFGHLPEVDGVFSKVSNVVHRATTFGNNDDKDPSSDNVGVTITPEYPLPSAFDKDDTDPLVVVSKTDANLLQIVHSTSLEPKRLFTYAAYDKRLDGTMAASHHKSDFNTGETFNFSLGMGPSSKFTVFSIKQNNGNDKQQQQTTILADITHRKLPGVPANEQERILPPYTHAFWLTENYVIIPEGPLHFVRGGADILLNGALVPSMAWRENSPGYLHVVHRHGDGHVITLPVDPFFIFHTSNAWDTKLDDGTVVLELDACAWPDGDIIYQINNFGLMHRTPPPKDEEGSKTKIRGITVPPSPIQFGNLVRYRLEFNERDTSIAKATQRQLTPNVDFPRYNPLDNLKPYKYLWGCQHQDATVDDVERLSLIKIDTETGKTIKLDREKEMYTEPVFVPKPGAVDHDDGVLLSFVNITDRRGPEHDSCVLAIIDAKSMVELARCDIGQFSCLTFHGSFISDVHFETSNYN
ncbi:carotene oxygenase [Lichtheimia corymbifera JMRC:FSU:9682]|uniref:Carotene oxygenase n=1 Tax=Lichtheimia corymbifera JMRC:FSU:9682 TaxID=1263082 RepID=A0A068RLU1_9FUNG|nr:carotene oxygenase [Lichtheimia corymbifera JMRC:FSU:9682]